MWINSIDLRAFGVTPLRVTLIVAALVALTWTAYAYAEARNVRVDRHTVRDSRIPESLNGTTLVFAADIHAGPLFGATRVRGLVSSINAEKPDIIALGGDYVGGRTGGAELFYPEIAGLESRLGTFAVLGNHDVWEGVDDAREGFADAGITLFENELARVGDGNDSIVIAGLEDEWTGSVDSTGLAGQIGADEFAILVAHNPDSFDVALSEYSNVWGLALAGHTHGGQVRGVYEVLNHKPTQFGNRFLGGWTEENDTPILVSNGVGSVTVPLRSFAPAQIHVITLESGSQ